jgi:DNA replication licensing factor MCM6
VLFVNQILRSVLHLSDVERTTSQGIDREELIEWYLEQKEHELSSVEDLESERDIIAKALTRLVKDKYLMELRGSVADSIGDETMDASATGHTQVHYVVRKSDHAKQLSYRKLY